MEPVIRLICLDCIHYCLNGSGVEIGCNAFPEGIPKEIIERNEHSKPIKGQANQIVFELVELR